METSNSTFYPFEDYAEKSEKPSISFYIFVAVYTCLCFALITPVVLWSEKHEKYKRQALESKKQQQGEHAEPQPPRLSKNDDNRPALEETPFKPLSYEEGTPAYDYTSKHAANANNRDDIVHHTHQKKPESKSLNALKKSQTSLQNTNQKIAKSLNELKRSQTSTHNTSHSRQISNLMNELKMSQTSLRATSQSKQTSEQISKSLNAVKRSQTSSQSITQTKPISKSLSELKSSKNSSSGPGNKETGKGSSGASRMSSSLRGSLQQKFDKSYPDRDPDFQNRIAHRFLQHSYPNYPLNENGNNVNAMQQQNQQQRLHQSFVNYSYGGNRSITGSNQTTAVTSSVASAATTSNLRQARKISKGEKSYPFRKGFSTRVLDVGGRRWKTRRPIGRIDVIERQLPPIDVSNTDRGGAITQSGQRIGTLGNIGGSITGNSAKLEAQLKLSKGMSDIASSILSEQHHELNHQPQIQIDISLMKRHQFEQLYQLQQLYQMRSARRYSPKSFSSVMSSIVDDISPDDAPDANDPGRGNIFVEPDQKGEILNGYQESPEFDLNRGGCCSSPLEGLLSLIAPDIDRLDVFKDSIPLTLGACSEALFRLITIAFISQILGTESTIAFLLVGLFVRLTSEELAGAIIDALSSFVQVSMDRLSVDTNKKNYEAGQYIQLGVILQILLNIPLLVLWATQIRQFVIWLLDNKEIAGIAESYTKIVVCAFMIQALSRTFTVVFHVCGHEQFESVIDLVAAALQVIAIALGLILVDDADLDTVAYLQTIVKMVYPAARGWIEPFNEGIFHSMPLWNNSHGIWLLLKAVGPLLLGTVLEYGEWELLTLFVTRLGPAEVAAWALLGALWDFFEALTEGFGEAAANKVYYLLSAGCVDRAKNLSYGVIYMSVVQSVLITSILYMSGQYLTVLLVADTHIRRIVNDTLVMFGIANIIMAYSRIAWSLVGSQGRFRLATLVVFFSRWLVTMPCALICVTGLMLDLTAVSGSLVVGYATACSALTIVILRSDWHRLSTLMQVMNQGQPMDPGVPKADEGNAKVDDAGVVDDPILGLFDLEDFDDSEDDSDGFGFGDNGVANEEDGTDTIESVSTKETPGRNEIVQRKMSGRQSQLITADGAIVTQKSD
eukprot:jgi/Psemu1/282821/fgenesh1_pg.14_\